ncbi:MAG: ISL3 family transposase, partial [Candidatus Riflebacteria bacterium]|nr:ISL3 family transposase [Candidatus Riflebacteria bacterium]
MQDNSINKLLNLKKVFVENIVTTENSIKIFVGTQPHECICPACGNKTSKIHDYRTQVIKDIPYMFQSTYIILKKRRYACKCGKHFYESYDFLPRYHRMTNRLVHFVCRQLEDVLSLKKIAKLSNLSASTIARIVDILNYSTPSMPKVVCIDEFKGNAETGKFQCILVDGKKHKILDILPDRTTSHLMDYFVKIPKDQRQRVNFFVCDMWTPYAELAKVCFPNAKIIIDKYHFIRQVSWAIEGVRKRLQKTMPTTLRKYYKRSKRLLLARYKNLSTENKSAVDLMLLYNDDLRLAHSLKEQFYEICQSPKYSEQRQRFADWIKRAEESGLKEFIGCANTYRNWYKEILNAFKYNYTNGVTEGFNNKIKVLKRVSYG